METLQLSQLPVAVAFRETPPAGVARITGTQPSGCSFWRLAAAGAPFYTVPEDHLNCPIGAYTHNIPLPDARVAELNDVLQLMTGIGYIRMEEVPGVPRLPQTPAVTVYAPLGQTPVDPDVVLVAGAPAGLMRLHEAAARASKELRPMMGRPTCAAIPAALAGGVASSLGCIGNRVYTGVADSDFYTVVAGRDLADLLDQLPTITSANATLAQHHRDRRQMISTS